MSDHARHHRRRSTQVPISGTNSYIHNRLPRLFSGHSPAARKHEDASVPEEEEEEPLSSDSDEECLQRHSTGSSFLASAARTYSRAMYAHTTSQIASPDTGTLPGYNRTMHAFTLNQLNHMDNTGSHNPDSLKKQQQKPAQGPNSTHKAHIPVTSPLALKLPPAQNGSQDATRSLAALSQMSLDEEPCGPSNTPEPAGVALASAPTSMPSLSSAELLSQGRELEATFNGLMAGVGVESVVGGLKSEARDFAAVGLVQVSRVG